MDANDEGAGLHQRGDRHTGPPPVRESDLILVLDDGQVVQRGTHAELAHAVPGHYRTLVEEAS